MDKASLYGPVFLDRSFSADPLVVPTGSDEPNGTTWFLISGQIRAAKWAYNSSTSSIYLRCYTKPCVEKPDLPKCIDVRYLIYNYYHREQNAFLLTSLFKHAKCNADQLLFLGPEPVGVDVGVHFLAHLSRRLIGELIVYQ